MICLVTLDWLIAWLVGLVGWLVGWLVLVLVLVRSFPAHFVAFHPIPFHPMPFCPSSSYSILLEAWDQLILFFSVFLSFYALSSCWVSVVFLFLFLLSTLYVVNKVVNNPPHSLVSVIRAMSFRLTLFLILFAVRGSFQHALVMNYLLMLLRIWNFLCYTIMVSASSRAFQYVTYPKCCSFSNVTFIWYY